MSRLAIISGGGEDAGAAGRNDTGEGVDLKAAARLRGQTPASAQMLMDSYVTPTAMADALDDMLDG